MVIPGTEGTIDERRCLESKPLTPTPRDQCHQHSSYSDLYPIPGIAISDR